MASPRATAISALSFARMMDGVFSLSVLGGEPGGARRRTIAVAVSGGADSMALLFMLARWRDGLEKAHGSTQAPHLQALTVDHGLRAAAAKEARQVGRWAWSLGVAHRILTWDGPKPRADVQAAARDARYRLMLDWCVKRRIGDLALAHHLDDQAETFLLRLGRGSGVDGLAAMAPVSVRDGVRLVRPLLEVPGARLRATLKEAGKEAGLDWIEDPSNEEPRFMRVRVRQAMPLLAELGLTPARLAATAARMARARTALERETARFMAAHGEFHAAGYASLAADGLGQAPEEIGLRALTAVLKAVGGALYPPRHDRLEALYAALGAGRAGRGRTLGGCKIIEKDGRILVVREVRAALGAAPVSLKAGETGRWDNRFDVRLATASRARGASRMGGEVRALGPEGVAYLKRLRADMPPGLPMSLGGRMGLEAAALPSLPALWRGKRLLTVPFLGYRAARAPLFQADFRPLERS